MEVHALPQALIELQSKQQWVCWCYEPDKNGRMTKVPYQAKNGYKASTRNPKNWATYEDAVKAQKLAHTTDGKPYDGIGFVFNNDYTGIDWDHCVNEDGTIEEWAQHGVNRVSSYCELSPSGTGIHGITRALLPEKPDKEGKTTRPGKKVRIPDRNHPDAATEMYCEGRFFTMTGNHLAGTPTTIEDRQKEVTALFQELLQLSNSPTQQTQKAPNYPIDLSDHELIEKACNSSNGAKFSELWRGDTSAYGGDDSSADQAFCNMLAFWAGRDAIRMDRIFRQSGLYREKWDRNARSGETYGQGTINRAIAACTEIYDPIAAKSLRTTAVINAMIYKDKSNRDGHSELPVYEDLDYIPLCKKHMFTAQDVPIEDIRGYMDMQQLGDAQLFARCFEGQVCYDSFEKEWYLWRGHHWQRDMHDHIRVLVSGHLGSVYLRATAPLNEERARLDRELMLLGTDDKEKAEVVKKSIKEIDAQIHAFIKRAKELRGRAYNTGVLYFAEALLAVPTRDDGTSIWDSLTGKIGVKNGVLDLHTGVCRDGQPGDYIRTFSPTEWQGLHAPCPHFEAFLQALFELREDKDEVIAFLQRLLGYALTGTCKEAIFALLYGPEGRNGKSTLFKIIFAALGKALAGSIAKELLVDAGKSQRANGPKPDLLELQGKRIAVASETQKGDKLDISAIKLYTGGDELGGRPMFGKHNVRFDQTHTLFLHTNFKPHADPGDQAFWARACLIEFNMRFVEEPDPNKPNERKYDTGLERHIIEEELPGVLAYLVRGAMDYDNNGLKKPQSVKIASEAYRVSEDTLQTFINECCITGSEHSILSSAFITAYQEWSGDGFKLTSKELKKQMEKKGFKVAHTNKGNIYEGVKFVGEGQGSGEGKNHLVKGSEGSENSLHAASEADLGGNSEGSEGKLHKVPHETTNNGENSKLLNSAFTAFTDDVINGHELACSEASQCSEGKISAFTTEDLPSPVEIQQEYRSLYQQLQQMPAEKLASHGTVDWDVPGSGMAAGPVSTGEYAMRLKALGSSKNIRKVNAGRNEMLRKLGQLK